MTAPPQPQANPVLGSALDLRRSQIRTYERVMHEYGDVVRLVVGPPGVRFDLYCVFHPDGVRAVLASSRERYSKGNRFYKQIAERHPRPGRRRTTAGRRAPGGLSTRWSTSSSPTAGGREPRARICCLGCCVPAIPTPARP